MDAVIKLKASELNATLIDRIKALLKDNDDAEITISINNTLEYYKVLDKSRKDLEEGQNLISFTMEELVEYTYKSKR